MAIKTAIGAQRYNDRMGKLFAAATAIRDKHDKIREILKMLVKDACGVEIGYDNEALNKAFHALVDDE